MDSPRLHAAVAARVVAWHNRHPLARRIGAAQVHSVGYVVLPFAAPGASPAPAGDTGATGGSLRERALARARQGGDAALPPPAKALAGTEVPPDARANFDEDFIAPLSPRRVARWARRHGRPLAAVPPVAGAPLREVIALPLPAGMQPLQLVVLTAAIDVGKTRRRVLLGAADDAAVLGRRVPNLLRAGLLGLLLASAAGGLVMRPPSDPAAAVVAAAAPAASQAAAPDESTPASAALAEAQRAPPPAPDEAPPAADAPLLAVHTSLDPPPVPPGSVASESPAAASAAPAITAPAPPAPVATATSAPLDVEPQLGRIELPPLGLPRSRLGKTAAHDGGPGATGPAAVPALASSAPAAVAVAAPAEPPAAADALQPAADTTFAVASRVLRTRTEAEQVRDAMQSLLRTSGNNHARSAGDAAVQVDVLPQGDDFRVVGWPFSARSQAEKARTVLVSRGMRVEVLAF